MVSRKISLLFIYLLFTTILYSCNNKKALISLRQIESSRIDVDNKINKDASIEALIQPFREQLSVEMDEVIGQNKHDLTKEQPQSNLGNFNAAAILYQARTSSADTVHAAISNYGGMRIPFIASGDLKLGAMYELMPFDNMLVVLEIDGKTLIQYLDHTISNGGWPISKEIQILVNSVNQQYSYKLNGRSINNNEVYRVVTSDYLAGGGDNCEFLKPLQYEALGVFFRDALINFVKYQSQKGQVIDFQKDERVKYVK